MAKIIQPALPEVSIWSSSNSHYKILIDLDVNCVFVKHITNQTLELVIERYEDIFSSPLMRPGLNYFMNYTECRNDMYPDQIRTLADYLRTKKDIRGQCKHAIICESYVGYGYARMLDSIYNANQTARNATVSTMIFNIQNFTNFEEPYKQGLVWLGINSNYVDPF